MFRSSNPVLTKLDNGKELLNTEKPMTVSGTMTKAFILLLIAAIAGGAVLHEAIVGHTDKVMTIITISLIVGFIMAIVTSFVPKLAKFLSPIYAFAEGACLSGLSLILETKFPGIAVQAICGTGLVFFTMLVLYKAKLIRATQKLKSVVITSMISILVLYLVDLVGGFFHFSIPFVSGSGPMSLVFSGLVITIASLCLIIDFDFIEKAAQNGLSKDYEWYGAFGLMVTLVWLYVEILSFLSKLRNN